MARNEENERLGDARKIYEAKEADFLRALGADFNRTDLTRRAAEASESANRLEYAASDALVMLRKTGESSEMNEAWIEAERAAAIRDMWWKIRDALLGRHAGSP